MEREVYGRNRLAYFADLPLNELKVVVLLAIWAVLKAEALLRLVWQDKVDDRYASHAIL